MAKTKTIFVADDDREFSTESEAEAHNMSLKISTQVEQYIEAAGLLKAQAGLLRKHLPAYVLMIEQGIMPVKPEKAEVAEPAAEVAEPAAEVAEPAAEAAAEPAAEEAPPPKAKGKKKAA